MKALLLLLLASLAAAAGELRVAAAASLAESVNEVAAAYQKAHGTKVTPVLAASNVLARQIEEGAPIDVFISADEANMNKLLKANLVKGPAPLLTNSLVVVVPDDSSAKVGSAADLDGLKRIAIGDPIAVPAGVYAKAWLSKAGLWEKLQPKTVPSENVRAALAAVEAGNVDAAIVYKTDAAISKKVKIAFEVPASETPNISYPVAVVKESKNPTAAKRFVEHLSSTNSQKVFESFGFIIQK